MPVHVFIHSLAPTASIKSLSVCFNQSVQITTFTLYAWFCDLVCELPVCSHCTPAARRSGSPILMSLSRVPRHSIDSVLNQSSASSSGDRQIYRQTRKKESNGDSYSTGKESVQIMVRDNHIIMEIDVWQNWFYFTHMCWNYILVSNWLCLAPWRPVIIGC